jgi:hypothetical protein
LLDLFPKLHDRKSTRMGKSEKGCVNCPLAKHAQSDGA